MKAITFLVTPLFLEQLFHLPEGSSIDAIRLVERDGGGYWQMTVSHPDFADSPKEHLPEGRPTYSRDASGVKFESWGVNP